mgnify:CR=1 FL=1
MFFKLILKNGKNRIYFPQRGNKIILFSKFPGASKETLDLFKIYDWRTLQFAAENRIKDIKVVGNLVLSGTPIRELPRGLHVGGWLNLIRTPIEELPEGLHVGGSLNL